MQIGQARLAEIRDDLETALVARDAHELMRSLEVSSILDCAVMAAHASRVLGTIVKFPCASDARLAAPPRSAICR
ncbi:hypothetical protein [Mesorhizobium amorphae]|uniref:hypothetical protein n=1 Tax=Mesorhizobium amorphae TaxID=71433 RepID=UPI003D0B2B33